MSGRPRTGGARYPAAAAALLKVAVRRTIEAGISEKEPVMAGNVDKRPTGRWRGQGPGPTRRRGLGHRAASRRVSPRPRSAAPRVAPAAMNSRSTRAKRSGSSRCGKWPAPSNSSTRQSGTALLRAERVPGRDHPVLGAPHDQGRDRQRALQVVVGADALPADVDDGTGGGEEGASTLAVPERAEPPPDRADVGAGSPADLRRASTQRLDTREDGCGGERR